MTTYITEKKIKPINILIIFLLGIAAALFLIGSINSFAITGNLQNTLIGTTIIIYIIATIALLKPEKIQTPMIQNQPEIIEKIIEKPIEKIIEKPVIKYKERTIIKEVPKTKTIKEIQPIIIEKKKVEKKKSKYVGSSYNEKYHLRNCRFAGAIKPQYLIEENDKKFFELRGYKACKVCNPDKN